VTFTFTFYHWLRNNSEDSISHLLDGVKPKSGIEKIRMLMTRSAKRWLQIGAFAKSRRAEKLHELSIILHT
jgi:hypothetical protein